MPAANEVTERAERASMYRRLMAIPDEIPTMLIDPETSPKDGGLTMRCRQACGESLARATEEDMGREEAVQL